MSASATISTSAGPPPPKKIKKDDDKSKRETAPDQDPTEETFMPVPAYNLAGRPVRAQQKLRGIFENQTKIVNPNISGDLNTTPYWNFRVRANNREWIRLHPNSLSMTLFGTYANPNKTDGATGKAGADNLSLQSFSATPTVFMDPSVLATCFVDSVDVNINNVPVPTNANLNHFLTQYSRFCNVFHRKSEHFFSVSDKISVTGVTGGKSGFHPTMQAALQPFDYGSWDATEGRRIPIYMHGIFPFDNTCRVREAMMASGYENLFFPPGTTLDIRVNLKRDKYQQLFQAGHIPIKAKYMSNEVATNIDPLKLTVQDVTLTYESNIMDEKMHLTAMSDFKKGYSGLYDYDIVYPFHQALNSKQSFTRNEFQIPPRARMLAVMFQPDHALFYTPSQKKPPSGFSTFPKNCTDLMVKFNGVPQLVDRFKNLGIANNNTEISKNILFEDLKKKRLYAGNFESYFPEKDNHSINQVLIFDVENLMTSLTSILSLEAFYNADKSPENIQILVFSVHDTGRGEVKLLNGIDHNYEWKFFTKE